jgi:hypothetical protein
MPKSAVSMILNPTLQDLPNSTQQLFCGRNYESPALELDDKVASDRPRTQDGRYRLIELTVLCPLYLPSVQVQTLNLVLNVFVSELRRVEL